MQFILVLISLASVLAYVYASGSSYMDRANSATIASSGADVQITFAGALSGGPTANFCNGISEPYCNMTNTDTVNYYNSGFSGQVNVADLPTGGTALLVVQLNGNDYWTNDLTTGWQDFNYDYKGKQYFNSGDTITLLGRVTGVNGYGTTFSFGQNEYVRPVMFYLLWAEDN